MKIIAHRHTAIIVDDIDRMTRFYVALGFRETRRDLEQGEFISHLVALENTVLETVKLALLDGYVIELIKYVSHSPLKRTVPPLNASGSYHYGYDHIGFTVDDINAVIDQVQSLGGALVSSPQYTNPGLPSIHAYVTDPENNIIHLAQNA